MAITNASTLAEYASGIGTQNSTLTVDSGNKRVGVGTTNTGFLKIGDEYVKVTEVGFSSTPTGVINDSTDVSLGICTLPVVKVERGQLGIAATTHLANATARVHRGAFNIVESTVFFADPPKGNNRSRRDETNLPFINVCVWYKSN